MNVGLPEGDPVNPLRTKPPRPSRKSNDRRENLNGRDFGYPDSQRLSIIGKPRPLSVGPMACVQLGELTISVFSG